MNVRKILESTESILNLLLGLIFFTLIFALLLILSSDKNRAVDLTDFLAYVLPLTAAVLVALGLRLDEDAALLNGVSSAFLVVGFACYLFSKHLLMIGISSSVVTVYVISIGYVAESLRSAVGNTRRLRIIVLAILAAAGLPAIMSMIGGV